VWSEGAKRGAKMRAPLSPPGLLLILTHDLLQAASKAARLRVQAGGTATFSPAATWAGVSGAAPAPSAQLTHASRAAWQEARADLRTDGSTVEGSAGAWGGRPRPNTMGRARRERETETREWPTC
jgi:hypothetical protein